MKEIKLTKTQEEYREAIAWLLHPYAIGQGKTFLMAIVWIDIAKNWPNIWFEVWDHRPNNLRSWEYLVSAIQDIEPKIKINHMRKAIMWTGAKVAAKYKTPGINPYLIKQVQNENSKD